MQLSLTVRHGHHQVSAVLAHITHLQRGLMPELVLYRKIPLLRNGRPYVRIPQPDDRILKWISGGRQQTLTGSGSREIAVAVIVRLKLRTAKGRVHREPEIVARTLQVRRDPISSAQSRFSVEERRCPRHADSRLKIQGTVIRIVERAAIAVDTRLPGELDLPSNGRKVNLAVLHFYPRCVIFVTQSQIQRERVGRMPVVLEVGAENIGALAPTSGAVDSSAKGVRQP